MPLSRQEILQTALEAARLEVCRRAQEHGLPTYVETPVLVVVDKPDGSSQGSEELLRRSSMSSRDIGHALGDDAIPFRSYGLEKPMRPLAEHLNGTTAIADSLPPGFLLSDAEGVEAILQGLLVPLAHHYLKSLRDLAQPDGDLVTQLGAQLDEVIQSDENATTYQLILSGITAPAAIGPYLGVGIRPLSASERGSVAGFLDALRADSVTLDPNFVVPRRINLHNPRVMLSVTTKRPRAQQNDTSRLIDRVILALCLLGFDLGSPGALAIFDVPRWVSSGTLNRPFPLEAKNSAEPRSISEPELREAVDLARRMPEFGEEQAGRKEIALYRLLRGSGARTGGLLDFSIALEAALLGGLGKNKTELAYRFRLYGALFLRDDRDPQTTFAQLRKVYEVRSNLVHGSRVREEDRQEAEAFAAELAKAVVRKSIEDGWPDPKELDQLAWDGRSPGE